MQSFSTPAHDALRTKAEDPSRRLSDPLGLRLHRALSWLGRAERESADEDLRFILLWISFNAAYAREVDADSASEWKRLKRYLETLVKLDVDERIRDAVLDRFRDGVQQLVANRYVYGAFWKHFNGVEGFENWKSRFASEKRRVLFRLEEGETSRVLFTVFDRLYVLRNQLMHGAATWQGRVNREQVHDGAAVLGYLVPVFIDIMLENPQHDWGEPSYPVVEGVYG